VYIQKINIFCKQLILKLYNFFFQKKFATWLLTTISSVFLLLCLLGWYWSQEPKLFPIETQYKKYITESTATTVIGVTTSSTLIHLAETLLNKPGGFIANDIMPPGVVLDNISSWEIGVLIQIRDMTRVMRKDFCRSQSQSKEDPDLAKAEPQFNFDARSWMLPASESEYQIGINKLVAYTKRLAKKDVNTHFYNRADNLARWLSDVATRLGSLSQRLSICTIKPSLEQNGASIIINDDPKNQQTTPWLKLDDIVYEARGTAWALIHLLQAIRIDFFDILSKKHALASIDQIIVELLMTQQRIFSPMILNSSGFGIFTNHSLMISSYISRANIGIVDLKKLLEQG
jgi:hypothetical protein